MAFFRKADAKVRLIFELPKLFEVFFENYFFNRKGSKPHLAVAAIYLAMVMLLSHLLKKLELRLKKNER